MLKAVGLMCPRCHGDVQADVIALGENLTVYLIGECCGEQITVDLEKIVIELSGSKYAN